MFQRKSSIQTSKLNYPLKGQFSEQSFIKEETKTALLLSMLIWMENNFNSHEHLLDSIDLNTFHILNIGADLPYMDAQGPEVKVSSQKNLDDLQA